MEANYFTILYWFCHTSTWIRHGFMFPMNRMFRCSPSWTSLLVPFLWVIPVHQPQASYIMHQTWTRDSFHVWYYTCFNVILPNHPILSLSHRVQKTVLYICVSFAASHTGLSLPFLNILSTNRDNFTFFLIWLPSFLFLIKLLWLGVSILCSINVVKVGIVLLFVIQKEKLFTVKHDVNCGLVIYCLYYFEVHFVICWKFYHERVLNFVYSFSKSFDTIIWFLCFILLM